MSVKLTALLIALIQSYAGTALFGSSCTLTQLHARDTQADHAEHVRYADDPIQNGHRSAPLEDDLGIGVKEEKGLSPIYSLLDLVPLPPPAVRHDTT